MSRIFLVLVIALAVVVLVPPVREKVRPKMQFAFDPLYEWSAKTRVNEIRGLVKRADSSGQPVPTGPAFGDFVRSYDTTEGADMDPWGVQYFLVVSGGTFQVGSAGRDKQPGTADDILTAPEPLEHAQSGRRRRF